ncbi:MAG: hypothetical protein OEV78_04170 [Spirochaetia bacterium]|nr:hypothetical protein [Spirochaetia bacterium]
MEAQFYLFTEMKRTSIRIVVGFLMVIGVGSILLYMLGYRNSNTDRNWTDTFFTITSGVCVTGLTVMDISSRLNLTGQIILLIMIQIGGLGVLTISNWLALSFTGKLNIRQVDSSNKTLGYLYKVPTMVYLKKIITFTIIIEFIGAFILFFKFLGAYDFNTALWLAIFHSISAFCNAGFSLFSGNLLAYNLDLTVNFTIMLLIIIGGIGYLVIIDIYEYFKARLRSRQVRLTLHSRVTLNSTAWLIFGGTIVIYFLELHNSLKNFTVFKGIIESLFLSVTSRTAGFNTIPTGQLTNMSLLVIIVLMIIGASSGSTGGGIKTSTASVFTALLKSSFKKRDNVEMYYRSVSYADVAKVVTIIFCYFLTMIVAVTLLQVAETYGIDPRDSRGSFLEHLFEVVSALSTVGLSTGITSGLSNYGKYILMFCMFAGRVGLLVLVSSVIGKQKKLMHKYPVENIMIG